MKRFRFRLQRVLDFRTTVEAAAKETFLEARAARIAGESDLQRIKDERKATLFRPADDIGARKDLEAALERLDDLERAQAAANSALSEEEEARRREWLERKQEMEAMVKLRERELDAWEKEGVRHEQKSLDEWAVTRRAA